MSLFRFHKPELIIPTCGNFIFDELYQGQCVQIGGTQSGIPMNNMHLYKTHLYFKTQQEFDGQKTLYVKVSVPVNQKIIIAPNLYSTSIEGGVLTYASFAATFYCINASKDFLDIDEYGSVENQMFANASFTYNKNQPTQYNHTADSLYEILTSQLPIDCEVEIVEKPLPVVQGHFLTQFDWANLPL